jgi:precorrin-8X/cobalt-precorrin-8 methylmutase
MRKAHKKNLLNGAMIAVGNAPTALLEVVRMIKEEQLVPSLIVGMPVGFVSAAESKQILSEIKTIPWVTIKGRKGGSTLVVSAIHALLAVAEQAQ